MWLIAPTLIIHYVLQHEYPPPPEFFEAVVAERFAEESERDPTE
jgi:hypothetical protein